MKKPFPMAEICSEVYYWPRKNFLFEFCYFAGKNCFIVSDDAQTTIEILNAKNIAKLKKEIIQIGYL